MTGRSEEFQQLVAELEDLVAGRAQPGQAARELVNVAARRLEIELRLIRCLSPADFAGKEARKSVRVPCRLEGWLRAGGKRQPALITNLSCGGAGLEVAEPVERGADIELEITLGPPLGEDSISRFGQVAWSKQDCAGVVFQQTDPLDDRMLRLILDLLHLRQPQGRRGP